jgi:MOSC domain-containing protein
MACQRIAVAALLTTPVKATRAREQSEIELAADGARGDRRLFLVDRRGVLVNGKKLGMLSAVSAELDERERRLTLRFPDGRVAAGPVELGEALQTRFYSRVRPARLVAGPFSEALSEHAGVAVRLVAPADGRSAVDRAGEGALTLISSASIETLAQVAGVEEVDARRFRMTVQVSGVEANEEDAWVGRELELGVARVRVEGHVGRCIVTCRDPDSGELDLPTLDLLRSYRGDLPTTEPLALGVHASVVREGVVRVGDGVRLLAQPVAPGGRSARRLRPCTCVRFAGVRTSLCDASRAAR